MRVHTVKLVHLTDLLDALDFDPAKRDNLIEYIDNLFAWGTSVYTLIPDWEIENAIINFLNEWARENDEAFDEDQFDRKFRRLVADDVYINLEI